VVENHIDLLGGLMIDKDKKKLLDESLDIDNEDQDWEEAEFDENTESYSEDEQHQYRRALDDS
tara:strand:- start:217 stop:405 length:189 start_codon:yes stop_codon:yes gene_type:complete